MTSVLQCGSDTAAVSWEAAAGAVRYTVHAREALSIVHSAPHYTSCRSSTTSCQLNQLQCGTLYNLTVMAEDATCNSSGSISTILTTGKIFILFTSLEPDNSSVLSSLFPSSLLSLRPEQQPDLWHQFFLCVMDADGRCHGLRG